MNKLIISNKGKPRECLRLTGRDGPARLYCLDGLARLRHSGGPPGLHFKIRGALAWLARGNPVNCAKFKIFDISKRHVQLWRSGTLQYGVAAVKNTMKAVSIGAFSNLFNLQFITECYDINREIHLRNSTAFSLKGLKQFFPEL